MKERKEIENSYQAWEIVKFSSVDARNVGEEEWGNDHDPLKSRLLFRLYTKERERENVSNEFSFLQWQNQNNV